MNIKMASYPSLRDRVVVVSGGASGIGEAIVEAFALQHAQVAFLDIQDAAADLLVHKIESAGFTPPIYLHCDLRDVAAINASVKDILNRFNTVDVLVNNAGNDSRHSIEEVTSDYWDQAMAVNLKHQFFMTQAVIPSMKKAGSGSIINMSSISWAIPSTGLPVYIAAKAAVVGLTRTLDQAVLAVLAVARVEVPRRALPCKHERQLPPEPSDFAFMGRSDRRRTASQGEVRIISLDYLAQNDATPHGELSCNQNCAGRNARDDHPQSAANPHCLTRQKPVREAAESSFVEPDGATLRKVTIGPSGTQFPVIT